MGLNLQTCSKQGFVITLESPPKKGRMGKKFISAIAFILVLGSCSSLKQLGFSNNKQTILPPPSQNTIQEKQKPEEIKFLDNISLGTQTPNNTTDLQNNAKKENPSSVQVTKEPEFINSLNNLSGNSEAALQMKYAALLNTDASQIQNKKLFEFIDDWYGTRYCMGGTTKNCIDCSAFVQALFAAIYSISVPRTSITQYKASKRISTTQLKEGDLLFFHTRRNHGLVTHVGIYLQNNKFVHASSSDGVKISDMYEPYFVQHLVAAGRVLN